MNKILRVAELGINHNGSLDLVFKMIDMAVAGNCDYVKFQKRDIDSCYTQEELNKYRKSPWGSTNRELKEHLEFGQNEYEQIDKYCKEKGIRWFVSVWDEKSVDFIKPFNVSFIKIPSALNTNESLLNKVKETKIPVILSTGMTTIEQLYNAINILNDQVKYVLCCTSTYPTKAEDQNMNRIKTLKECFKWERIKIGFSNHNSGVLFIIMAAAMGCEMVEFHITLDRSMFGTDQSASIEFPGIMKIDNYLNDIEKGWGDGKLEILESEIPIMMKLRR